MSKCLFLSGKIVSKFEARAMLVVQLDDLVVYR